MQITAGQKPRKNNKPGPTGFGLGSGHKPMAAAAIMNRSGPALTISRPIPTLTHDERRYSRMELIPPKVLTS